MMMMMILMDEKRRFSLVFFFLFLFSLLWQQRRPSSAMAQTPPPPNPFPYPGPSAVPSQAPIQPTGSEDRDALLSLKAQLARANPNISSVLYDWVSGNEQISPCSWVRVQCENGGNKVTSLDFQYAGLTGPFPTNLSSLPELTRLSLKHNNFSGGVAADLGGCLKLRTLDLSFNSFSGSVPLLLGGFPSLQNLDISNNRFSGPVDGLVFENCAELNFFDASGNNLWGPLPWQQLRSCRSLLRLDLQNNNLEGAILPPNIPPALQELILKNNRFSGNLSADLFLNCSSLQRLDLSLNRLAGPIPNTIGNCQLLVEIDLSVNNLTGFLPAELGKMLSLRSFAAAQNNLTGGIPALPRNLSVLVLSENSLQGTLQFPTLETMDSLELLLLQSNNFYGGFPVGLAKLPRLRHLDLSYNFLDGALPLEIGNLTSLKFLYLASNRFSRSLPVEIGQITSLICLDLSDNYLTGDIQGSTIGKMVNLLWLMLAGNHFVGSIPPEISHCSSLLWLNLEGNHLTGDIPPGIAGMGFNSSGSFSKNAVSIDWLHPPVAADCSVIKRWLPVTPVSLYGAYVVSATDRDLCHRLWQDLLAGRFLADACPRSNSTPFGYVRLSGNKLSGDIPGASLSRIHSLAYLALDDNAFTGHIPDQLSTLPLRYLNLSQNYLQGPIPAAIGQLSCLTALDLSLNNLSGTIPPSLGNLTLLTEFNVSFNPRLSGPILMEGQFSAFGKASYLGNPLLCVNSVEGASFEQSCSAVEPAAAPSMALDSSPSVRKPSGKAIAGIVIGGAGVVFILAGCGVWLATKCPNSDPDLDFLLSKSNGKHSAKDLKTSVKLFGTKATRLPFKELTYSDLVWATNNFQDANILGRGSFGVVYKAHLGSGLVVAVKHLQVFAPSVAASSGVDGHDWPEFVMEMQMLGSLRHTHLVPLLGCCVVGSAGSEQERLLLIRYMVNASLDEWLHVRLDGPLKLDWPRRLGIIRGAAAGLCFLHHDCGPAAPIVHGNIKSSNVLLDSRFNGHLGDFGLARILEPMTHVGGRDTMILPKGANGYLPPEYNLKGGMGSSSNVATIEGDVYSLGVVMLELATGRRPMGGSFTDDNGGNLVEWVRCMAIKHGQPERVLDPLLRKSCSDEKEVLEFLDLALNCTMDAPERRPTMRDVTNLLQQLYTVEECHLPMIFAQTL